VKYKLHSKCQETGQSKLVSVVSFISSYLPRA